MTRIIVFLLAATATLAQPKGANYDESKVPHYTLPNPLVLSSGAPVRDAKTWTAKRRPEILALFENNMQGHNPARFKETAFELTSIDPKALGGKAIRKEITVLFNGNKDGPKMSLLLYLPANAKGKVPVFLGPNFQGNQTVHNDPGIRLGEVWIKNNKQPATEASRGAQASRWQLDMILAAGFGLATFYYSDVEPDFKDGKMLGIRSLDPNETWGAIGAWAYALSRAMDYLETDKAVDSKRVAVIGHSRLGKTSLWAGALDTRFALVISNDSGEGGAAISRRKFGEEVHNLNASFPHWFSAAYKQWDNREAEMPIDAHMLLALIAPRPLYVASAQEDLWADPKGEFLAAVEATKVYHLFNKKGIETSSFPAPNQPVGDTVRYHVRTGKHDVTAYDWEQYIAFARRHFSGMAK